MMPTTSLNLAQVTFFRQSLESPSTPRIKDTEENRHIARMAPLAGDN